MLFGLFNAIGETLPSMVLARQGVALAAGRSRAAVAAAAESVADDLCAMVQPFAETAFAAHREAGRPIVLATTTPYDLVKPFADRLGLDDVVATRYSVSADGTYDGTLDGPFVWSAGKLAAIAEWADRHDVDLAESYAYSDSVYDTPMLAAVGHPIVVNPDPRMVLVAAARRWPTLNLDVSPGVLKIPVIGLELQQVALRFARPSAYPYARFDIYGVEHIPVERCRDPRRQPPQLLRRGGHVAHDRRVRPARPVSSARKRCSTRRSSDRSPRRWAASVSTGGPAPTSRWPLRLRHSMAAKW